MKPLDKTDGWKVAMDECILKNSSKARLSVSYSSTTNLFDQYHRNANNPVQSNDLIKLPILLYGLDRILDERMDDEEIFKIRPERLLVNLQGMLGEDDAGKLYPASKIMEAIVQHNDNAASNLMIDRLGKKDFNDFLKAQHFANIYFLDYLDDRTKDQVQGAANFVATGDLVNLEKRVIGDLLESRKGKLLLDKYFLAYKNHSVANVSGIKWVENTKLAKGSNYYFGGDKGFVLVILVSNFSDESQASKILEEAESIFFSGYNLVSSN